MPTDLLFADAAALLQVVLLDLALAGDNAVAVGLAASALPKAQQRRVIFWGILLALVLRIVFATGVKRILELQEQYGGILLAGGLVLLWVAWRMWADLAAHRDVQVMDPEMGAAAGGAVAGKKPTSFGRALLTIIVADVSMSLDNVIAVAGVARNNADWILWFGLVLAVGLMGIAASVIARVIEKYRWIAIVGVVIIVIAAGRMIWEDAHRFVPQYVPPLPAIFAPSHPPA